MPDITARVPRRLSRRARRSIMETLQSVCPEVLTGNGGPSESIDVVDLHIRIVKRDDRTEPDWAQIAVVIDCPAYDNVVADAGEIARIIRDALIVCIEMRGGLFGKFLSVGVWVRPMAGGFSYQD